MSREKKANQKGEKFIREVQKKESEKKAQAKRKKTKKTLEKEEKEKKKIKEKAEEKVISEEKKITEEKKVEKLEEEKKEKPIEKIKFYESKEISIKRKKKPKFRREELCKLKRLKDVWRRPRGKDSKVRKGKRGKSKSPKIGYKNPEKIRGLIKGYKAKIVHNVKELMQLNPKEEAAIIAKQVGRKKRNEIIREANKLMITILNPRKGEI